MLQNYLVNVRPYGGLRGAAVVVNCSGSSGIKFSLEESPLPPPPTPPPALPPPNSVSAPLRPKASPNPGGGVPRSPPKLEPDSPSPSDEDAEPVSALSKVGAAAGSFRFRERSGKGASALETCGSTRRGGSLGSSVFSADCSGRRWRGADGCERNGVSSGSEIGADFCALLSPLANCSPITAAMYMGDE